MSKDENILSMSLEDIMGERFGRYSKYIIQDRALPDARDGLKPVQRRILYAMYRDGNIHDKPFRKSAKTVGNVIGNYHPHGDSSVYDAMVRMSQEWKLRNLLIEMHGNNGSLDGDPAAAMRYTEARLSAIASELLRDIDKETVDFAPNFDDSMLEPTVLPSRFPNLLVNGAQGISAGYATDIPPHNLSEIIDATIKRIDSPQCTIDDLLKIVKGPDFPTGGIVQGIDGIKTAYETGKGKIIIRSRIETEEIRGGRKQFVITEIPYDINKANLVRKMDEIRVDKKIDGISEVRDESSREGLRIVVELKKDAHEENILNYFLKNTDLQRSYNFNMVAIANKRPVQMGLLQLLDAYINHQIEVVEKRSQYELKKSKERLHIVEGLVKVLSILDEVIATIRASKDKKDAKDHLIAKYDFSELQAEAIVMLQLYRLTNTDVTLLVKESDELTKKIEELESILNSDSKLRSVIKDELKEMKKLYHTPRLSVIQEEIEAIVIDEMAMIPKEDVIVTVSKDGYIKRVSMRSFTASNNEQTGLKEEDYLLGYFEINTIHHLLLFTNKGNYVYLPVHEIPDARWKDLGKHFSNIVTTQQDESIIAVIPVPDFNSRQLVITCTKEGYVKRTELKEFEVQRFSKTYVAMKLRENDELVAAHLSDDTNEVLLVTKTGFALRYAESEINIFGIKAAGVKGINLGNEDEVIGAFVFENHRSESILVSTNRGKLKRIKYSHIGISNRAKKGELVLRQIKSKPHYLVNVEKIVDTDQLTFKTTNGIIELVGSDLTYTERELFDKNDKDSSLIHVFQRISLEKVEISLKIKDNKNANKKTEDDSSSTKDNSIKNEPKTKALSIDDFLGDL